jgi:hypothetical protein
MAVAEWRKANPDKVRAQRTTPRAKATAARWRRANPDKSRAYSLKWLSANQEREHGRTTQWRKENPDKVRAAVARWNSANADYRTVLRQDRRWREAQAPGSHTIKEWRNKKAAHDFRCIDCGMREGDRFPTTASPKFAGTQMKLTVGHAVPLKPRIDSGHQPGSNFITNIIPQCAPCNSRQGNKPHYSVAEGNVQNAR